MQHNHITGVVTHVDFLIIDMKKEIEVSVPLEFTGLAEAEKNGLGTPDKGHARSSSVCTSCKLATQL